MMRRIFLAAVVVACGCVAADAAAPGGPASAPATAPSTMQAGGVRGRGRAPVGPRSPAELPGKGMAQHDFMYAGEAWPLNIYIVRNGKIDWQYTHPGRPGMRGEISDATMLSNGNILFAWQFGASLVSPEKKILWNVDSDAGTEIHTACPMGLDRVVYIVNSDPTKTGPAKLIVQNIKTGEKETEFNLPSGNGVHLQFRHVRVTPEGHFLVGHMDNLNKVAEYDKTGKEVWSVNIRSPWSAIRLKNGNTLITSNANSVTEVNPKGETVWQITPADLPGYRFSNTQTAERLANGNTLFNNWDGPDGAPVQWVEVTPEKKVVWALREWTPPNNLGRSSNIQILDEPGKAEDGELQR